MASVRRDTMIPLRSLKNEELRSIGDREGFVTVHVHGGVWCALTTDTVKNICSRFFSDSGGHLRGGETCWNASLEAFQLYTEQLVRVQLNSTRASCLMFNGKNDLYKLWKRTSCISAELFADPLLESGVCQEYCTEWEVNGSTGCVPMWTRERDNQFVSAGATPPSVGSILSELFQTFEENVVKDRPFCRTAVLPIQGPNGLNNEVENGMFGNLLMEVPFSQGNLSSLAENFIVPYGGEDERKATMFGLFVWVNRPFLRSNPPPRNIEQLYMWWLRKYFSSDRLVVVHMDAFLRAFPRTSRSSTCVLVSC